MEVIMSESTKTGLGWVPDLPDFRDYHPEHAKLQPMMQEMKMSSPPATLSPTQDLRAWCSPIENQGGIGSCTANAGVGLIEYYELKAHGNYLNASRLFLYKATRNLLGWTGDTGAYLRSTMGAMALFGVPPEKYWAYTDADPDYNQEPTAFCYSFAKEFQSVRYFRLDPTGISQSDLLARVKLFLAAGLPSMFGFTVFSSIGQAGGNGEIPFPGSGESVLGGHAVVAVGYDDNRVITNQFSGAQTQGALLIRNSWGIGWGDAGYGWLPYDYIIYGLAQDWWSLFKQEYTDTKEFGF